MFSRIKNLFLYLDKKQKKNFAILQLVVVLNSFLEILGVSSILPFISLVSNKNIVYENDTFSKIYIFFNFIDVNDFIIFSGFLVFFFLLISTLSSIVTIALLANFANQISAELSNRLFKYYIDQKWIYHLNTSSSLILNNIHSECSRVTGGIVDPLMQMISRICFSIPMCIGIFLVNPLVAIFGILIFLFSYFIIYKVIRKKVYNNGVILTKNSEEIYKIISEAFGGIKNVILSNSSFYFTEKFNSRSFALAKASALNKNLQSIPKFLIEFLAFGCVVILILFLYSNSNDNFQTVIPQIAFFALAGYKLIPSFQQIYMNITNIKANISALDSIENDLRNSVENRIIEDEIKENFKNFKNITLKNINFSFKKRKEFKISDLNLNVNAKSVVGIAGQSGSGKSTIINLILGLLEPSNGNIHIDDKILNNKNIKSWQKNIGYVPQSIFLCDGTLKENIGFGIDYKNIKDELVENAIKQAELSDFVNKLPEKLDTKIGERGVKLSGGQQQRVGIARALYHDPNILIFDEATSSLDEKTEKNIMNAINKFSRLKTIIIIAHRTNTLRKCDNIFIIENGSVVNEGNFESLFEKKTIYKFKK
tara:strand:+ start:847 stop:2631 length:1785 start_codon:yes stop_codon:yes gene_type:complete